MISDCTPFFQISIKIYQNYSALHIKIFLLPSHDRPLKQLSQLIQHGWLQIFSTAQSQGAKEAYTAKLIDNIEDWMRTTR